MELSVHTKKNRKKTINVLCKTGTVNLAFTQSNTTTSFEWESSEIPVKDALKQAFGAAAAVSAAGGGGGGGGLTKKSTLKF